MNSQIPVIAGVEITTDVAGRFNLNTLHKASGTPKAKAPNEWLRTDSAQSLICELDSQTGDSRFGAINKIRGGNAPGTFAHELLAISYAGWISPVFQLKVNQVFLDYRSGKLKPDIPQSLPEALRLAAEAIEETERLTHEVEELKPKAEFCEQVEIAEDAITVAQAAKLLGTGRNRLLAFLRKKSWVRKNNEPYQDKVTSGYLETKLSTWDHPDQGLKETVTTLVTGKGLVKLRSLYGKAA